MILGTRVATQFIQFLQVTTITSSLVGAVFPLSTLFVIRFLLGWISCDFFHDYCVLWLRCVCVCACVFRFAFLCAIAFFVFFFVVFWYNSPSSSAWLLPLVGIKKCSQCLCTNLMFILSGMPLCFGKEVAKKAKKKRNHTLSYVPQFQLTKILKWVGLLV